MKGGVYRILTSEISNEKNINIRHIPDIRPFLICPEALHTLFPHKELTVICRHRHQKDTESQNSLTSPFHIRVKAEETEYSKKLFLQEIRAFEPVAPLFFRKEGSIYPKRSKSSGEKK